MMEVKQALKIAKAAKREPLKSNHEKALGILYSELKAAVNMLRVMQVKVPSYWKPLLTEVKSAKVNPSEGHEDTRPTESW